MTGILEPFTALSGVQLTCIYSDGGAKFGDLGPLTVRGSHVMPVLVVVGCCRVCPCLVARVPWCRCAVAC